MRWGIPYYFTMKVSTRRYFVQNLGPFQIQRPPIWGEILWPSIGKSKVASRSIAQESTPIMRYGHSTHDDSQPIFQIGYIYGGYRRNQQGFRSSVKDSRCRIQKLPCAWGWERVQGPWSFQLINFLWSQPAVILVQALRSITSTSTTYINRLP